MKKIAVITALSLAALAGPASAKDHPEHASKAKAEHGKAHEAKAHKCKMHGVAYVVGGTLVSGTLTKNDEDGTYDGTLIIQVARANHHAQADQGMPKTYELHHARVNLHGQDPAAALKPGSRVKLQGKVTKLNKKCDQSGFTATTTIKKASIKDPKAADTSTETETEKPAETPEPAPIA